MMTAMFVCVCADRLMGEKDDEAEHESMSLSWEEWQPFVFGCEFCES